MFRPSAGLAMLACACGLIVPATAIAQDRAAENGIRGVGGGDPAGTSKAL